MKSLPLFALVLVVGCGDSEEDEVSDPGGKGGSSAAGSSGNAGSVSAGTGGTGGNANAGKGGGAGRSGSGGTNAGGKAGEDGTSGESDGGAGDETGGTGGTDATGGSGGSGASAPRQDCSTPPKPGLPSGAPKLEVNRWVNITPEGLPVQAKSQTGQGLAVDVCNPGIIYYCAAREGGGVYKSLNGGGTWERLGGENPDTDPEDRHVTRLTFPIRLRIDPSDSNHLYAGDGVEGSTNGYWRSFDGGHNWEKPQSYLDIDPAYEVYVNDVYDVAVNPSDFQHVLVTSHSDPFILESKDGGDSWIFHPPPDDIGTGHSIAFLHDPDNGIGNSNTWLLGTQTGVYLRTENAGETWERVSELGIVHGGGNIYRAKNGAVYATAESNVLFSSDNGASWDPVGLGFGTSAVWGDGVLVYANPGYQSDSLFYAAPEEDGEPWEQFSEQTVSDGIFEMGFDPTNRILYAGGWYQHVFAMKVP